MKNIYLNLCPQTLEGFSRGTGGSSLTLKKYVFKYIPKSVKSKYPKKNCTQDNNEYFNCVKTKKN